MERGSGVACIVDAYSWPGAASGPKTVRFDPSIEFLSYVSEPGAGAAGFIEWMDVLFM